MKSIWAHIANSLNYSLPWEWFSMVLGFVPWFFISSSHLSFYIKYRLFVVSE
jgi:hypothetical protein